MKLKPDYKVFTFKRVPFFIEDDAGGGKPRARRSVTLAAFLTMIVVLVTILVTKV
jgi:hypothetical protein